MRAYTCLSAYVEGGGGAVYLPFPSLFVPFRLNQIPFRMVRPGYSILTSFMSLGFWCFTTFVFLELFCSLSVSSVPSDALRLYATPYYFVWSGPTERSFLFYFSLESSCNLLFSLRSGPAIPVPLLHTATDCCCSSAPMTQPKQKQLLERVLFH